MRKRPSKYHAKKVVLPDGQKFDSKHEYDRYRELLMLERAGKLCELRRQVPYVLSKQKRAPDYRDETGKLHKGKVIERPCTYIADFVYRKSGEHEYTVEDAKGFPTPEYIVKRKWMLDKYGIHIEEV